MKRTGITVNIRDNWKMWLYRILVAAAAGLMIASFIMPWWVGRFETGQAINIYGWGLRHNLVSLSSYLVDDVTPIWQTVIAWVYVGLSVILALVSTKLGRWKGSLLLGIIGVGLMVYAFVAVHMVITNRLADFGIALEGFTNIQGAGVIIANLQTAHTMAYIAGGIWLGLAVVRGLVIKIL